MKQRHKGRMPYSWFYFNLVKNVSKDKTFHSCQIPSQLVEMLIKSCTKENDNVFILFGGSGNELILCQTLKRNFISCELHTEYYEMITERLKNKGTISNKYRLDFKQKKCKNGKQEKTSKIDIYNGDNITQESQFLFPYSQKS